MWPGFLNRPKQPESRPRCESPNPYVAGYEDRIAYRGMSVHLGSVYAGCQCARCTEYRAGWLQAEADRIEQAKALLPTAVRPTIHLGPYPADCTDAGTPETGSPGSNRPRGPE